MHLTNAQYLLFFKHIFLALLKVKMKIRALIRPQKVKKSRLDKKNYQNQTYQLGMRVFPV